MVTHMLFRPLAAAKQHRPTQAQRNDWEIRWVRPQNVIPVPAPARPLQRSLQQSGSAGRDQISGDDVVQGLRVDQNHNACGKGQDRF